MTNGFSPYAWLIDYTKNCTKASSGSCNVEDNNVTGFWVSGSYRWSSTNTPYAYSNGNFVSSSTTSSNGIRPVIDISKAIF